jgi:hypothetical protein
MHYSTVDRKNGVHHKHTFICQDMYPPELKLKRANECSMNAFQTSILGVFDDFPYNPNQNNPGAEGSISPPTSQTLFKLLTTHTKLR